MNEAKKSREKKGEYIAQSATHWPFTIVKNRWMCIEYGSRHMIEIVSFSLIGMLESFFCHGIYLSLLHYLIFFSFDCSHIHCSNHYFMTTKKIMAESS